MNFRFLREFKVLLCGLGSPLLVTVCAAQPTGPPYDVTLEARMAKSQSVVRGHIAKVERKVIVPANGTVTNVNRSPSGKEIKYTTVDPNGKVEYLFSIKLDELIRGPRPKPVTLTFRTDAYDVRVKQWAEHKTSFLWFFGDGDWSNLAWTDPLNMERNSPGQTLSLAKQIYEAVIIPVLPHGRHLPHELGSSPDSRTPSRQKMVPLNERVLDTEPKYFLGLPGSAGDAGGRKTCAPAYPGWRWG